MGFGKERGGKGVAHMLAASIPKAMRARKGRRVERESCIVVE